MKKIIVIFLLLLSFNTTYSYDLNENKQKVLDGIILKISKIYEKEPLKSNVLISKIELLLTKYDKNSEVYYMLNYILEYSKIFLSNYNATKNDKIEIIINENTWALENTTYVPQIDIDLKKQNESLKYLELDNLKTISSFSVEAKYDHIYLKNIYLKNTWTISDINWLFNDIYLVDGDNKIVSMWYVEGNYFYFNISSYIIKRDETRNFYIKTLINIPENINQTWELSLNFSSPLNALNGTSNWLRAISYSNWNFISSNAKIFDIRKTFISKNSFFIKKWDFVASYYDINWFSIENSSIKENLDLVSFEFKVYWSFLDSLPDSAEFVLKKKWSNQVFWRWTKASIVNGSLVISLNWDDYNYISPNSIGDYILELNYNWNISWFREVKLENIVISDWFWWTIDNLKNYSDFWFNDIVYYYKY